MFDINDLENEGFIRKENFIKFLYNYPGKDIYQLIKEVNNSSSILPKCLITKKKNPKIDLIMAENEGNCLNRNSELCIQMENSMLNENQIINFSNFVDSKEKSTYRKQTMGKTLGLTAQPYKKQPTNVSNKIRHAADIIFNRYAKNGKLELTGFSQWLKIHKEFLNSFRNWFRTDLWKGYYDNETGQPLLSFHKKQADLEGYVKSQKYGNFIKKKAYIRVYDCFLFLFRNERDNLPYRVIVLKLVNIGFNNEKRKILISHGCKKYKDLKIIISDKDTFKIWKNFFTNFTNNHIDKHYIWDETNIIGKGRFSTVYSVMKRQDRSRYALKLIHKKSLTEKERQSIINEKDILSSLDHINLVKLHKTVETNDNYFYVFEEVKGQDLYRYVTEKHNLEEYEASYIMKNLFDAVDYLHSRGIIHRDLKPDNIMLELKQKRLNKLKIIDFGIACFQIDEIAMGIKCGTLNYTAPEILLGHGYDFAVDTFSLGVIMYFIIRGNLPFFHTDEFVTACKTVDGDYELENDDFFLNKSESCKDLLKRLLETDPSKRITIKEALSHDWIKNGETLKRYTQTS